MYFLRLKTLDHVYTIPTRALPPIVTVLSHLDCCGLHVCQVDDIANIINITTAVDVRCKCIGNGIS